MKSILLVVLLALSPLESRADINNQRLVTWNILCATCTSVSALMPWDERKAEVVEKIKGVDPYVIALQEVQQGAQLAYMLAELDNYNHCIAPLDNQFMHVVILVRKPAAYSCLPVISIIDNRSCVGVTVDGINFYNCHFPLTDWRNEQSADIFLNAIVEPFVFMGDFNTSALPTSYPDSDAKFLQYLQTREPDGSDMEFWNIDRIGTSLSGMRLNFVRDPEPIYSDHPFLHAVFRSEEGIRLGIMTVINLYLLDTL